MTIKRQSQDRDIADEIYQGPELKEGAPTWFHEFMTKYPLSELPDAGLRRERGFKNVAIFQPYHAHGKNLLALLENCTASNLEVYLTGLCSYAPSWTFTIAIYHSEDQRQVMEYVALCQKNRLRVR